MRSPRFSLREPELRSVFSISALKGTWKRKVRVALRERQLVDPIEYLDFHINLHAHCSQIERMICDGTYHTRPARRILMEKSKGICRQIVIPSIQDSLVLQRLSDALYADIKGKAPSDRAFFEPEDHRFSHTKKDALGAPEYGSLRAWLNFQKELFNFATARNYVVVTDIANYYDYISYEHLRNIIASHIEIREVILDTLIFVLSGLLWQPDYMPRVAIGLPQIDLDAPRILAHCFLYDLDEYFENNQGADYVRYMDDIDVGTDSISEARRILRDIDIILHTRQVRLNSGKTFILARADAERHFRIRDNHLLDLVARRVDRKNRNGRNLDTERRGISSALAKYFWKGRFDFGNGDKILKRLLTLARKVDAQIHTPILASILRNRPSCRIATLRVISSKPLKPNRLKLLISFLSDGAIVDDVALVETVEAIVRSRAINVAETRAKALGVGLRLLMNGTSGLHSAIWLMSKYADQRDLVEVLRATFDTWRGIHGSGGSSEECRQCFSVHLIALCSRGY